METNNSTSSFKIKPQIIETEIIDPISSSKTTSLRPTRSIIPPRSLYRTGIKTTVNYPKDDELLKDKKE